MATTFRIDNPEPPKNRGGSGNPLVWALVGGSLVMVVMAGVVFVILRVKTPASGKTAVPAQIAATKRGAPAGSQFLPTAARATGFSPPPASPAPTPSATMGRGFGWAQPRAQAPVAAPVSTGFGAAPPPGPAGQPVASGFGAPTQPTTFAPAAAPAPVAATPSPQDVIARNRASVLLILTETDSGLSSGTGFVVSPGQVATCEHVISDARSIYLLTVDGRRLTGAVAAADPRNDVAVLNVGGGLPPALSLGFYGQAREGDEVAVTGYPKTFTMLEVGFRPAPATSRGSISGKRERMLDGASIAMLQTDTAINPGNSGGPLYSLRDGTVYGIASAGLRDTPGVNFAASIDALRRLLGR